MLTIHQKALAAGICAAAGCLPTVVMAQGAAVLEEVVVTAEHREASLQDTQISLSAINSDAIAELGISNGLDIGEFVPNLNAQPYVGGRTGVSFNIRGIGNSETLVTFDPAVSVYLDGVLIAKNVGSLLDVLDLERVEVLRGPQGTLYGRNTMGGAVNYVTKKPSSEFEAKVKATVGRFNQRDLRGMINVPLSPAGSELGELNLRASVATINRDGILDNEGPSGQNELGTKDRDVAMLQLMWAPTDTLSVNYSYDMTRIDEIPDSPFTVTVNPDLGTSFLAAFDEDEDDRPSRISVNDRFGAETDVDGHALTITWDISDTMTLTSLTGYRELENLGFADSDGSPFSVIFTRDQQAFESTSQEFRLVGTALDAKLNYSTGIFFYKEEGDLWNQTDVFGGVVPSVNVADFDNEAVAVYGQFTYQFTDRLDATFGIRYTDEERKMRKAFAKDRFGDTPILTVDEITADFAGNTCVTLMDGSLDCGNTRFPDANESFDNISPMVSVSYNWNDDVMTYAKVSTGYQSGGFNARDEVWSDFTTGFDEETITAYEVGMKSTFQDRYQFNAAAFFSDYDDKRINQFNPETLVSVQVNAGVVEISGLELEFLAQLNENFQVGFNYGYLDPDLIEYDAIDRDTGLPFDAKDTLYFPFTPQNSYSAFVAYEQPLNFGILRARMDYSYRDNMNFLTPKVELNESEEAKILNARVTLEDIAGPGDSRIRVSVWAKNLTDESYWNFGVNIYNSFGFDINTYGEPRTYGLDAEITF